MSLIHRRLPALLFRALMLVGLLATTVIQAGTTAAQFGTIINLSGRQRMLSQKMSKELLLAALDIDRTDNLKSATQTAALFETTLQGLRDGSAELSLPAEKEPGILRQLDKAAALWVDYRKVLDAIIATGKVAPEQIRQIAELNLPIVEQMNRCVKLYEGQASVSSLWRTPSIAVAVNLSGRQRMLSQRMSKEYLLLALGHEVDTNRSKLLESTDLFARTLQGLREGDTTLALSSEINTPELLAQLEVVQQLWNTFEPLMRAAIAGEAEALAPAAQRKVAQQNGPLLAEMNKAVSLYEALTK